MEGFNPGKVRDFLVGMETTLGSKVASAVIFDRDYRSLDECNAELTLLRKFCRVAHIHSCKELENFLLVPGAITRAVQRRVAERNRRSGDNAVFAEDIEEVLLALTEPMRYRVQAHYLSRRREFEHSRRAGRDDSTIEEQLLVEFDYTWRDKKMRMLTVPGKEALSKFNSHLQEKYNVSVSAGLIVESFLWKEVPEEMVQLLSAIDEFRKMDVEAKTQQVR